MEGNIVLFYTRRHLLGRKMEFMLNMSLFHIPVLAQTKTKAFIIRNTRHAVWLTIRNGQKKRAAVFYRI